VLNMRCPSLDGRYLADQWRRLDPKAIVLNESYDARINFPGIEQPENYLLISQMGFVNHSGAPARITSNIISEHLGCRGAQTAHLGSSAAFIGNA
jgi:hypothetical protein